jgi:hypothetical protein
VEPSIHHGTQITEPNNNENIVMQHIFCNDEDAEHCAGSASVEDTNDTDNQWMKEYNEISINDIV